MFVTSKSPPSPTYFNHHWQCSTFLSDNLKNLGLILFRQLTMNEHVSTIARTFVLEPHWLSVKVRSTYKVDCLCHLCHSSTAPSYVADMLQKKSSRTLNTCSSSYTMLLLNRPSHSKATLGDRLFSFAILLSGNLFQMMSCATHHHRHLSLV